MLCVHLHARRGHWIPIYMVVSHHVVAGIELRTSGRADGARNYLSNPIFIQEGI